MEDGVARPAAAFSVPTAALSSFLFDPLRRGSLPAHKGEHASLGLGLFLVREIAIAHGGDVAAQVEEGVTTFVIHLPRSDTPAA